MSLSSGNSFLHIDNVSLPGSRDSALRPYSLYSIPQVSVSCAHMQKQDTDVSSRGRPASYSDTASSLQQNHCLPIPGSGHRRFSDISTSGLREYPLPTRNRLVELGPLQGRMNTQLQTWRYRSDISSTGQRGHICAASGEDESPESIHSVQLGSYAPSVSEDGLSSVYECTASDFPAPPPITSPVIRRMRSSPWYRDDYNENLRHLSEHPWTKRSTFSGRDNILQQSSMAESSCASFSKLPGTPRVNNDFTPGVSTSGHGLECTGTTDFQESLPTVSSACNLRRLSAVQQPTGNQLPAVRSQKSLTTLKASVSTPLGNATTLYKPESVPERQSSRPFSRLPRIIRKVASMRSEAAKHEVVTGHSGPATGKTIPKARSFRSILQSAEADKARERINGVNGEWHRPTSWVLGNPAQVNNHSLLTHEQRRQHLSVPTSKSQMKRRDARNLQNDLMLEMPFSHRSIVNENNKKTLSIQEHCESWDSFMNISPDRGQPGFKTGRMKNLLARAGNSMFGWSKRGDRKK